MNVLLQIVRIIGDFYASHEGVLNLLGVAAVLNMPPAKNILYKWLRDTLQSFVGALKPHVEPGPTQPVDPAQK